MPIGLSVFVVIAYALSWAWWLPIAFSEGSVSVGIGSPTHFPGLVAPALAALGTAWVFGRRLALSDLFGRIVRIRFSWRGWLATLAPIAFLGAGALVERISNGAWPDLSGLGRYSGLSELGVVAVIAVVFLVNALGEEIGWRGFALPRLQARFGPLAGTVILFPIWALWHLPLFWAVATYQEMSVFTIAVGWGLGLFAGTLVLANVTHLARGGVLAAAIWHTGYNMSAATDISGAMPMVATILVTIWGMGLLGRELMRRGESVLSVPPPP